LAVAAFLQRFAYGSLPTVFVLYADYRYGWDAKMIGLTLALIGGAQAVVSGGLVRPAIARLGERGTLLLGLVCGAAGFALYGWAPNGTIFLLSLPLVALWGLVNPAVQSLASKQVKPTEQGQLQGAQSSMSSVADMISPWVFTQIFAAAIVAPGIFHLPGAPYFLSALLIVAAFCVCWGIARPMPGVAETVG
jgi:DHA1 family tetracycline resistance protein-like MFS transporter